MNTQQNPAILSSAFDWDRLEDNQNSELPSEIDSKAQYDTVSRPLELFLDIPEYSPRRFYETREIVALCSDEVLLKLQNGTGKPPTEVAVWLDDRDKNGAPRSYNGAIPVTQFFKSLKLRRIGETNHPNAETRRIHIPHPSSWTIGALILMASHDQLPVFRNLFLRHLRSHRAIEARFAPGGTTFSLEFHLPFFALRSSVEPRKDSRQRFDKSDLRKSRNLSFLCKPGTIKGSTDEKDFLYEAQSSLVITGYSSSRWTSCSLQDTYFHENQEDSENEDLLSYYEKDETHDFNWDAPTIGKLDADNPTRNPREYFLRVLNARVEQVKEEWTYIAFMLRERFNDYMTDPEVLVSQKETSLGSADGQADAVLRNEEWIKETSSLLTPMIIMLCNTIAAWDSFASRDAMIFSRPGMASQASLLLQEISLLFKELKDIQVDLEGLKAQLEDFKQRFERHIMVQGNRAIVLQYWNVTFLQVVSPVALAAAMMQCGIVPFQPAPLSFAVLVAGMGLITYLIKPALTWHSQHQLSKPLRQDCFQSSHEHVSIRGFHAEGFSSSLMLPQPTFAKSPMQRGWNKGIFDHDA